MKESRTRDGAAPCQITVEKKNGKLSGSFVTNLQYAHAALNNAKRFCLYSSIPRCESIQEVAGTWHEDGTAKNVCVDRVENRIFLRNTASVDDAANGDAVLGHAIENDASVEGGTFDGGAKFVLKPLAESGDHMRMNSFCQYTRGDAFFGRDSQ